MADPTTTPLVERLRAQAVRHRENATGLASAALLEEAAEKMESDAAAANRIYTVGGNLMDLVFRPNGMTDLHDLQAFLDAVEATLARAEDAISARYRLGRVGEIAEATQKAVAEARAAERERCARIADDYDQAPGDDTPMGPLMAAQVAIATTIAAEIRAGA